MPDITFYHDKECSSLVEIEGEIIYDPARDEDFVEVFWIEVDHHPDYPSLPMGWDYDEVPSFTAKPCF